MASRILPYVFGIAWIRSIVANKALTDWYDGYTTFYGGAPDRMNPDSPSYGTKEGSCGYGVLDREQWPYWAVAGLSVRVPDHGQTIEGCGSCYEVMCNDERCFSGKSVVVVVTDKCPECREGHFDLQARKFEEIAPEYVGNFYMKYRQVECSPPGNMQVQMDDVTGSWMRGRMYQAAGSAEIETLEVAGPDRNWVSMTKTWGATFELNGYIEAPMSFRVTDSSGNMVVSENSVYERSSGTYDAGTNFGFSISASSVLSNATTAEEAISADDTCDVASQLSEQGYSLFSKILASIPIPRTLGSKTAATILAPSNAVIEQYAKAQGMTLEDFLASDGAGKIASYHVISNQISSLVLARIFHGSEVLETLAGAPVFITDISSEQGSFTLPSKIGDVGFNGVAKIDGSTLPFCRRGSIIPVDTLLDPSIVVDQKQPVVVSEGRVADEPSSMGKETSLVDLASLAIVTGRVSEALSLGTPGVFYNGEFFPGGVVFQVGGYSEFALLPDETLLRYTPESLQWYEILGDPSGDAPQQPQMASPARLSISGTQESALVFTTMSGSSVAISPLETEGVAVGNSEIKVSHLKDGEWKVLEHLPEKKTVDVHGQRQELYIHPVEGEGDIAIAYWNREILQWSSVTGAWTLLSLSDESTAEPQIGSTLPSGGTRKLLRD